MSGPIARMAQVENDDTGAPHPVGTLVLCKHFLDGMPLSEVCENHVFVVSHEATPVPNDCGFLQRARCLVCDRVTAEVNAGFFFKRANAFDIAGTIGELQAKIEGLQSNLDALLSGQTPDVPETLQDFG